MSYLIDPRNPLCVPDLSGRLLQHWADCNECNGTGHIDGESGYPPQETQCEHCKDPGFPDCCALCDPCPTCGGEGQVRWWCWYSEDRGQCDVCHEDDVLIDSYDDGWVCLPCYLKWHRDGCGCDRWKWAEEWILGS